MILDATPIITSLLDTDAYKLHMQQAVYHHYSDIPVVAEFRRRSDERLGEYATTLRHQVDMMADLSLTNEEFGYLQSLPFFKNDYLQWFKHFRFKPEQVHIATTADNQLTIKITGPWREVILWEVPLLALVSEIVHRARSPQISADDAVIQLRKLIDIFYRDAAEQQIDLADFKLMDFGTRRRFSYDVQRAIVDELKIISLILSAPVTIILLNVCNWPP